MRIISDLLDIINVYYQEENELKRLEAESVLNTLLKTVGMQVIKDDIHQCYTIAMSAYIHW